jgi:long-subunit acyl-CoA synthetase (AMP-forming)
VAVRGASLALGYRQAGELRPAADAGGWLDTGDAGAVLPDGNQVLGPASQVLPGAGFTVPLALIDAAFRYSPYVRSAVTSASAGGDLGALLDLDFATIARWAATKGISYRSRTALLESDAVGRLLEDELEQANARLTAQGLPIVRSISLAPARFTPGIEINALGSPRRVPEADSVHNPAVTTSAIGDKEAHHAL